LPLTEINIYAEAPGYIAGFFGQRFPHDSVGLPVTLGYSSAQRQIAIKLYREAAISGEVLDDAQVPVVGATVRALRPRVVGGREVYEPAASTATDSRGSYRLAGLVPGKYLVAAPTMMRPISLAATGEPARLLEIRNSTSQMEQRIWTGYPTTYYPATTLEAAATIVVVTSGAEVPGIDLKVTVTNLVKVSGRVSNLPTGRSATLQLLRTALGMGEPAVPVALGRTESDNSFVLTNVPLGQYVLRATSYPPPNSQPGVIGARQIGDTSYAGVLPSPPFRPISPMPSSPTLWTEIPLDVGEGGLSGLDLILQQGGRLQGHVTFQGGLEPPPAEQLMATPVFVYGADGRDLGDFPLARIEADSSFMTVGLPPGNYLLFVRSVFRGWHYLSTSRAGAVLAEDVIPLGFQDVNDLQLSLSSRATSIAGSVVDATGAPVEGASVYLFPRDRRLWLGYGSSPRRFRECRTSRTGAYVMADLVPGDYFIAAISSGAEEAWRRQEFLTNLIQVGSTVKVSDGDQRIDSLKVVR
jgi:hypothetical protein